ncbi:carbohydrate binding family 9 domain-containing protein [candidate division KSB1 bacterium]|nr:carbohydrate binding family 9 domain-containing protein [candidate division KSB1 bacterium]
MKYSQKQEISTLIIIFSFVIITHAFATMYTDEAVFQPFRAATPPQIDGILDDEAWKYAKLDTSFLTYNPTYGDTLPQKTLVYLAYDVDHLYFAFNCLDDEPDKIKTSIAQRDRIFSDDWVGFSLDAIGNKQSAYDIFVNPNGIQADILSTPNNEDTAPDWVWHSAGVKTEHGYQVEISVPLKSIQYQSGDEVTMGLLFWRKISRLGLSGSYPEIKPGQSSFTTRLPVRYTDLSAPNNLQFLPSLTVSSINDRSTPSRWSGYASDAEVGVGVKYAITSMLNVEATYNPDFSQVESDAFQVQVNQRYPLFFSEKRPFFMEAGSLFNLAGTNNDNNMLTAMHTRRIVDPDWGGSLTGSSGRASYAVLAAEDAFTEYVDDANLGRHKAYFAIGRTKYSFKNESYIGMLYSDRELGSGYNRVIAADLNYRPITGHTLTLTHYQSYSRNPESGEKTRGSATVFNYMHFSKPMGIWMSLEEFQPQFNMETAFYFRSAMRKAQLYLGPAFYPTARGWNFFQRVNPFVFAYYLRDLNTGKDDQLLVAALRVFTSRQGQIRIDHVRLNEYWQGENFHQYWHRFMVNIQAFKWLFLFTRISGGRGVYYSDTPCMGRDFHLNLEVTIQPGTKFNQGFEFYHSHMNNPEGEGRLYSVNIINSRTTYQFNRYFFLRGIVQYDSHEKKAFTDFLASFTFIPGTVLHLGYGSLYQQNDWRENEWVNQRGRFHEMKRSFFFKASYLWRV